MNPKQLEELIEKLKREKAEKEVKTLQADRMKRSEARPLLDRP